MAIKTSWLSHISKVGTRMEEAVFCVVQIQMLGFRMAPYIDAKERAIRLSSAST
jgi:hypothetical protein